MATVQNVLRGISAGVLFSILFAGLVVSAPSSPSSHHISKRHILQMCELITNHTGRGCFDYLNYGCYCGLGNAASRHIDGVDGCCLIHDRCYGEVSCWLMYPQFVGYSIEWDGATARCTDDPFFSSCQYTTCQCDLVFSQCLSRHIYNPGLRNYDRRQCHSGIRTRRSTSLAAKWRAILEKYGES